MFFFLQIDFTLQSAIGSRPLRRMSIYFPLIMCLSMKSNSISLFNFLTLRFYDDFGPFNLAQVYRYCRKVNRKLKASALSNNRIVHCTSAEVTKRTNAAFLCGCYQIIYLNRSADEAYKFLLSDKYRNFAPYR